MKSFLILGTTTSQTKIFLDVVNVTFNSSSDFVSSIPFFCSTNCTRIRTKVFFGICVNHSSAGRCGAWVIAMTDPFVFTGVSSLFPCDFGTHKFVSCNTAFEFGCAFIFHWKRFILWTAGNAVSIQTIVGIFEFGSWIEWNISFCIGIVFRCKTKL